ncbi:reverse transcriptase domain-containing protein [Lentzea sp. NPDC005914]|uniref:reverse transcriptase domain-containing protein n=1 Tax=Lentzea sp. NPDC005914 TaxID=3154572 RepID=UPI0033D4DE85
MRASGEIVSDLEIESAASRAIKHGIEHFPPLMSDICLTDAAQVISDQAEARLEDGYLLSSEVVAYPRKSFGIRPVLVAPLTARAVYGAAVRKVQSWLPEPSRANGNWDKHKEFGLKSESSHVVEFDIASCYEYVDHARLREELAMRTSNAGLASLITGYLSEVQGRAHGLPQFSYESDLLADTYLNILDRRLHRGQFVTSRFADDFKILASSFDEASEIIELCSEYARDLCLVLSTEKTRVMKKSTLKRRYIPDAKVREPYFKDAENARRAAKRFFFSGYGDVDVDDDSEIDPDELEYTAYHSIVADWAEAAVDRNEAKTKKVRLRAKTKGDRLQGLIPEALSVLRSDPTPVDPDFLRLVVYDNIARLESVVKYIVAHPDGADYWHLIHEFTEQRRQSPWLKLWIIYAANQLASDLFNSHEAAVIDWIGEQIEDRHELVRAEAAWVLAEHERISVAELLGLYQAATELTRPLLAATVAIDSKASGQAIGSLQGDGRLMSEAIKWARKS